MVRGSLRKPSDLSSVPKICVKVGDEDSTKLSSGLHACTSAYISSASTHAKINSKYIFPSLVDVMATCLLSKGGFWGYKEGEDRAFALG